MTPEQWQWLEQIGSRIRSLLAAFKEGNIAASTVIGERVINGRRVRLTLLAEVVDAGADPLQSHAGVNLPTSILIKAIEHEGARAQDLLITPLTKQVSSTCDYEVETL